MKQNSTKTVKMTMNTKFIDKQSLKDITARRGYKITRKGIPEWIDRQQFSV